MYEDDPENWGEMIDTNIKGIALCDSCDRPGMVERNRGHVINMGSTAGYITYASGRSTAPPRQPRSQSAKA